ncbi:MAG: hypothetical protein ACLR5T_03065 [Veillonella sp.]
MRGTLFNGLVNRIILNDYDFTIFCFWESILYRTDEFIQLVTNTEVTINEWHRQKAIRDNLSNHSNLEIGFSTFFLNRTNRSGIVDKAGPIGGLEQTGEYLIDCRFNKLSLVNKLKNCAHEKISIYNLEALDFIEI